MRQRDRRFRMRDTVLLSGWLFADLLLALAVIFLSANTVGVKPRVIPTSIPTPTARPSPTPLPRLELSRYRIILTIDSNGLLNDSPSAINDLKQKIRGQAVLRGRTAGLVIVYGGAPDVAQVTRAQTVVTKVINVLVSLGNQGFVFTRTSYYDPLYILNGDANTTVIDIYLFAR
jgi:hypothetical protein